MSDAGLYRYRAHVDRWVDADTVDLLVDLGFGEITTAAGINASDALLAAGVPAYVER